MIEVSHVSRTFGNFRAVDDISFSIPTGQIVGLLGPNGAGKTTTMRMITGFLRPTSGQILIDGVSINETPVTSKRKIGYMPESAPLYREMIVADYLKYIAEMYGQNADEKVPALCETCALAEVMSKNIGDLSRGYRQRVGLAHALMNDPEILILDEPTSGLDPNQIGDVRSLIKEIGKTRTVIVSTHILGEVEMLASRVIIISGGKVVADSPTSQLRERYSHSSSIKITAGKCSDRELTLALSETDGIENISTNGKSSDDVSADSVSVNATNADSEKISLAVSLKASADTNEVTALIAKKIIECGWNLYELYTEKNSLEDVFHELTAAPDKNQNEETEK